MGVLIRINISQQHDEIDITPAQLCLNSLYYLALIMQKKWNISSTQASNLIPCTLVTLAWLFFFFLSYYAINYIYFTTMLKLDA